jgi:hypothetical protein
MQELALLLGIVIAEWISLYPRTMDSAGYRWLALKRSSLFLLPAIAARWAVGWIFLRLSLLMNFELFRSWIWAAVVGLIVVFFPSAFERILDNVATAKFVRTTLVQLLLRFNLLTGQTLKASIQRLKEQDNFDCQCSKRWWDFGLDERQVNRRLRMLYEEFKMEIASDRREPELLRHSIDISPGQKFYLLVAHLGRKGLRRALKEGPPSPPPGQDWDGTERRRKVGSKADRKTPDANSFYSRVYDYKEVRNKVASGQAVASKGREGLEP